MTVTQENRLTHFMTKLVIDRALSYQLLAWYRCQKENYPWRRFFAETADPYVVWVSEVMLQQTQIKTVLPKYLDFLNHFPDVKTLALADESKLRSVVCGLGYYRRFAFLQKGAQAIVSRRLSIASGFWPTSYEEWLQVPGVGDYTASAIASIAFDKPHPVVDGNVERVFCRLFNIQLPSNLPSLKKIFKTIAHQLIVPDAPGDFNQALMELGQKICLIKNPKCSSCPIKVSCKSFSKKSTHLAPKPKIKKAATDLNLRLSVLKQGSLYALRRRGPNAKFLRGARGFCTEILEQDLTSIGLDGDVGNVVRSTRVIGAFRHAITHHRLKVQVCEATGGELKSDDVAWLLQKDVEGYLESSLDKKAWHLYLKEGAKPRPIF